MNLIDTHTHINLRAFKDDAAETIKRALDSGVAIINVGTQIDTSREAVSLLQQFPENVYATVGLHPSHAWDQDFIDQEELQNKTREDHFDYEMYKQLANDPRVVGIGECGLDYFRLPEDRDHTEIEQLQKTAFQEQIKLALELGKVVCVHCRPSAGSNDAYEDTLEILGATKASNPSLRFEIHCFTGDLETAQRFVELGGCIGINGIITFDKTTRSREVVEGLPLEAIILETDAPYLAPVPYRGQRNEPAYVIEVAKKIAEWKNLPVQQVADVTSANAKKLFQM